ncbi:glycosyl hydrolase-related protein [Thalassoglobus sp.]|uniref:glycoside hydrolase family 38 N-terminal domain-containing protein n=1 Tax=Thalassoglobus sp. TaxID=2795869 RepID=UPI003AA8543D
MKYNDLIVLVPCHSLEDFPTELGEEAAASLLNAFSILWHPSLLASTGAFPKWERSDESLSVQDNRLVVVPTPCDEWVPATWVERARREGCVVISGEHDREEMLHQALEPLELEHAVDSDLVADFLALGTVYLQVELLTRHMRNFSHLDESHMQREAIAAAQAAINHDVEATRKHLSHCFEMLLECRERFYPVACYLIDLCLVNPDFASDELKTLVESSAPTNLLATAADWETIAEKDASWSQTIGNSIKAGTLELIGGEQTELPTPLMALDSTLWQLRKGRATLERLFDAKPTTWARKRFGLGSHLPQILDRLGYTAGLHFVMDDGIYPDDEQTLMRWEGSDGTAIDAFSRIPLAADSAGSFLRFPVRMAESMDYDHTAAVVFARWPKMKTPWLEDLRRASAYAPVLGKFVTFSEFFETSDSQGRMSDFNTSAYFTLDLIQSVAKEEKNPISRWTEYWERRRRFESVDWAKQLVSLLSKGVGSLPEENKLESLLEAAHSEASSETLSTFDGELSETEQAVEKDLSRIFASKGQAGKGMLLVNPQSFARKSLIKWKAGQPGTDRGILQRQIDQSGSCALVDLPPCGFLWVSANGDQAQSPVGKTAMAEDLTLRNELFQVALSDVTGGIARVSTYTRSPNRVSQQIAFRFPRERTVVVEDGEERESFKTYYSFMQMRESRVLSAGPVVGEIETIGDLVDGQNDEVVATYRQVTRVVRGRPNVDVEIELDLKKTPSGDPWTNYIGCRFAWKHTTASLTGSMQQAAHAVGKQRIEAPQYLEIADDDFRTTILTPGYPFHRKTGDRMIDTLLITEGETKRKFQFSIAVDVKYPMQAHLDAFSEPLVIPTDTAPPEGGQQGWLFFAGAANVLLTRILPTHKNAEKTGFIVRLLETEGRTKTFPLKCFRTPQAARQVNFQGETIHSLHVQDDQVMVEIAPYEICDVELTFDS